MDIPTKIIKELVIYSQSTLPKIFTVFKALLLNQSFIKANIRYIKHS